MIPAIQEAKLSIELEDYPAAIRLLRPLAESGLAEAQCLLGSLYILADAIPEEEARGWLQLAAKQDHPAGLYHLFVVGPDPKQKDDAGRRALLVQAAELGHPDAQAHLGTLCATGDAGFPLDLVVARHWYSRAADQGHPEAQYELGFMLLLGE